ncbi:restriction endonuclease subunit S [Faecalibacterium sp. i20-0019-C2]|uniref:restriction endonuclease subunit S n=1 Tax=unclassified Faecalibacterium TaxID=2646395 RepID=UPI0034AB2F21
MTSEWNHFALGEITELVIDYRGKTPKKLGGDWCKQGYRALSAKNIKTGRIVQAETIRYIDESLYRKWMKDEVQRGDILITSEAPFGQIFFWDSDEKIVLSQRLFCVRIKPEYDARFIYYYMTTPEFQSELDGRATGTTVIGLRQPELMKCIIRCPEIQEQKVIAAILSSIDAKIIANEKVNDNLEQQAQAIYHERFETVSPNDLPSDWRIVTLGEVATISNKSFNPLKEPEILLEHYSIPAFDEARFPVFELSTSIKSNKFIIDASCFMISKLNPTTKRVWKPYCLTGNAVCSTEFIVYKAKDQSITDFLYSVIDSGSFSDFMCSHVTGSTGSRQRTTPSDTLSYELILPSEDELAEFQSLVSPMYAQMRINAIENDKLKRLRDSLLPKLMSGEIDVSAVQL